MVRSWSAEETAIIYANAQRITKLSDFWKYNSQNFIASKNPKQTQNCRTFECKMKNEPFIIFFNINHLEAFDTLYY